MRLFSILVVAAVGLTGPALALDCGSASADLLKVADWKVSVTTDSTGFKGADVEVTLTNGGLKAIRLVDAVVVFQDALGGYISTIGVDRDAKIAAGKTYIDKGRYLGTDLDRVPGMKREDVQVLACTNAVVYDDGTKQEFK